MSDPLVRKSTRVEFAEVPAAVPGSVPPLTQLVSNAAMASLDKKALLIGGYCNGTSLTQVMCYDSVSKQWDAAPSLPAKRSDATAVPVGGNAVVVFGGYNDTNVLGDTLVLRAPRLDASVSAAAAEPVPASPPAGKDKAAAAAAAAPGVDVKTLAWETVASDASPPPRRLHSMTSMTHPTSGTNFAYVFGGFGGDTRLNDLWELNLDELTWRQVEASGAAPAPRDGASLVADAANNRLVLYGGYTSSRVSDLYVFDIETSTWVGQPVVQGPSPRYGAFAAQCGNHAIFGLGCDAKGPTNQVFQLNLQDWKWTVVAFDGDELEPRTHFSAAPMEGGKKLLVFGGTNEKRYASTLWELEFDKVEAAAPVKGKK